MYKPKSKPKENLIQVEINEKNIEDVKALDVERNPIDLYYMNERLVDGDGNTLKIVWKGLEQVNLHGQTILKGKFYLGQECR